MEITPEIQAAIDKQVSDAVKDIKSKLDNAYADRDAAREKASTAEKAASTLTRDQDIALLRAREEGRTTAETKLAETAARIKALEDHNRQLSRDQALSEAMTGFSFRTPAAQSMARELLLKDVQQDETGKWVAKDCRAVSELVKTTLSSEDHSFLLKAPVSTGTGTSAGKTVDTPSKSLLDSSNEEIFKRYM